MMNGSASDSVLSSPRNSTLQKIRTKKARHAALKIKVNTFDMNPKSREMKARASLCTFPSMEKCTSIFQFPEMFAKCLTSGDFISLNKLLHARIDLNCGITLANMSFRVGGLVTAFELNDDLHPDSIYCVYRTKLVSNDEIHATMYFKYTDNAKLRQAMEGAFPDPLLFKACSGPRGDPEQRAQYVRNLPDDEKVSTLHSLAYAEEVVMYGNWYMTIRFDEYTKKVTTLRMECEYTSIRVM